MRLRLEKDFTIPENEGECTSTVSNNHDESGEIAAPSPVEEHGDEQANTLKNRYPRHSRPTASIRNSYHGRPRSNNRYSQDESSTEQQPRQGQATGVVDDYTVPENYGELDEVAAPSHIDSRQSHPSDNLENRLALSQQGGSLKRPRTPKETFEEEEEQKITELAGPVQQFASRRTSNDVTLPPSPSSSEGAHKQKRPPSRHVKVSRLATEVYTVSYLILFSIFGTLARLGLQALTFYPGAPVQTGVLWCNFGGSLVLGFLAEDQKLFLAHCETSEDEKRARKEHNAEMAEPNKSDPELQSFISAAQKQATRNAQASVKKTIPLYIGVATGFCGSFTSFSSFMRDAYLALSNALPVPVLPTPAAPSNTASTVHRNGGYSFMAICAVLVLTVTLCIGALVVGAHLAIALEPFTPRIPSLFTRRFVDRSLVLLAWGAWLGAILMAIWPPDRPGGPVGQASWTHEVWRGDALFALVFAPVGCLLRFYASLHLNSKVQSFPLGTFAVNICGTAMEGMFYDLQHVPLAGRVGCQVLQGLMDGFCGCLTTVSTWVVELKALRVRHAYIYGAASVGLGVGLMVVIMGSMQWTVGFRPPLCSH